MNQNTILLILKLVDIVAAGLQLYGEDKERYTRYAGLIKDMIRENREPTGEEFSEMMDEGRDLTQRLKDIAEAKRAGEGGEPSPEE